MHGRYLARKGNPLASRPTRTYSVDRIQIGGIMSGHEHTKRCYWDFVDARWVCRPEVDEPALATNFPAVVLTTEAPVGVTADRN